MAALPPNIHTYHCICSSLLLASTHTLSALPRRHASSLDNAIILPLPSAPPTRSLSPGLDDDGADDGRSGATQQQDLPSEGYTLLVGLVQDKKIIVVGREDGFEKRLLSRCGRCALVVGYEILGHGGAMDIGKGKEEEGYGGKVMYILPSGVTSTEVMVKGIGTRLGEKRLREEDVVIGKRGVGVFE